MWEVYRLPLLVPMLLQFRKRIGSGSTYLFKLYSSDIGEFCPEVGHTRLSMHSPQWA